MKFLILASIMVLFVIGIVGVQESFATIKSTQNYTEGWYLGEGLKKGDYFSYSLCHIDYMRCSEFQIDFWIKGDKQVGSETKWLAEVVVYDEHEIIVGEMELGKISPEPTGGSEYLGLYRGAFKSSIAWLSAFSTFKRDNEKWSTSSWRSSMGSIGGSPFLPLVTETVTVSAGTWETIVVSWTTPIISKIWIVDDFPFPIKAKTYTHVSEGIPPPEYEFELLDYKENIQQSPFENIVSTPLQENCDTSLDREINIKKPTTNFEYQLHISYGPEEPVQGCEMQFLIKFISKYDDTEFLNQVQYDFLVVDENLTPLRSIAEEEGRDFLYSQSGQVLLDFIVKEEPGTVNYVIWIYGLAPEGIVPSTSADYLQIPVTISVNDEPDSKIDESFANEGIKYDGTVSREGCQIISGIIVESNSMHEACQYNEKLLQITPSEMYCGEAVTSWADPETGQIFQYINTCNHPTIFDVVLDEKIFSPKKQLEAGVAPEDIQCKESHVLVLRTNGYPACVTEKTADKLIQSGWSIVPKDIPNCMVELYPDEGFSSQKECWAFEYTEKLRDYHERALIACEEDYLGQGYDSYEKCYEQNIALFDPIPFSMYYEGLLNS